MKNQKPPLPEGIRLEVTAGYLEMSQRAAGIIIAAVKKRPNMLLCVSAGGTPTGAYACLAERKKRAPGLFRRLRILQIDEWGGLDPQSPATCAADLRDKLLAPLGLPARQFTGFRTDAPDPPAECKRISHWLRQKGPIDLCILGLGLNGHLAMNEPARELVPHCHVAALTPSSQQHAMLRDLRNKPKLGFTLGMQEILCSRQVLLLVSGRAKRAVLRRLLEPSVTTQFPASFLWLHPNATVLCDREAVL